MHSPIKSLLAQCGLVPIAYEIWHLERSASAAALEERVLRKRSLAAASLSTLNGTKITNKYSALDY